MAEKSRIRFNPVTKEIEIEGSEEFVKAYFDKLQKMMSLPPNDNEKEKTVKTRPAKKAQRVTKVGAVLSLLQASPEGLSTAELKEKTGLSELQIWGIVNRATKEGKIKKAKRGLYVAV